MWWIRVYNDITGETGTYFFETEEEYQHVNIEGFDDEHLECVDYGYLPREVPPF